ncbi:membrane associated rhomboid family serine protease [Roseibium hamelinense]|uniref:Membrane associated rhomboid family serine protease n=1 Tax=Roseibium hamelinense TaxID=150831 RepID=A0A562TA87_9HYPH|nr:rhomboid family intramembrane serine protease [Roseibium hamelinense]MTI42242.1 rhomboid family intramembrane serine protease [Roseibium hamelinense]TWI90542.1 membrane associated rhomboid family serine protease [Roseibium hamelinense]
MNVYEFKKRQPEPPAHTPALNLPPVIVWLSGVMIAIHVARTFLLPDSWNGNILLYFAFWPVRYQPDLLLSGSAPGGFGADIWSFVTYGLLHGGAMHIIFNLLWMAIFGSAVARRFGIARFLILSAACAAGGAVLHLMTHWGESAPMIGASAAVSGQMAVAIRFIFELGGPLGAFRRSDDAAYRVPAMPLNACFQNPQVLGFTAVWFGLNLFFGLVGGGGSGSIAWQAHIGGFITGLALFPLLDPVPRRFR